MRKRGKYEDMIHLPHHQSKTRQHMSLYDRAAQFSPFAALTGYEEAVKETARLTDEKMEFSEEMKLKLSQKLTWIRENISRQPDVSITYFIEDEKKNGGSYVTEHGVVKKIDDIHHVVIMRNERVIPIEDISEISSDFFESLLSGLDEVQ